MLQERTHQGDRVLGLIEHQVMASRRDLSPLHVGTDLL